VAADGDRDAVPVVLLLRDRLAQVVVFGVGDGPVRGGVFRDLYAGLAGHQPVPPVVKVVRHARFGPAAGVLRVLRQVAVADAPLVVDAGTHQDAVKRVGPDPGPDGPAQAVVVRLGERAGRAEHPVGPPAVVVVDAGAVVVHALGPQVG